METTYSAPTQPNSNTHNNTTNIETCFSTGLDLSDFGGNINTSSTFAAANPATSASAALAKIKSDAAARIRREEQEEAALERRVAAVDVLVPARRLDHDGSNNDSKDAIMPRALHPNSQPSSMAGEERDNNFIQFQQTAAGNGDFLSSLVTTHKTEGRDISNKSRMMLKSNSSKGKVKPGQRIISSGGGGGASGGVSSRRSRHTNNSVKQKASGKSVVKKSFKSKSKF
jgi:hypothetical protein